jgi:hypothetical protein
MKRYGYYGNNLETNAAEQAEMFRNVVPVDTGIFSPLAVPRLYVTIGSLLVSIQAFNNGLSRSILPIRTHSVI